MATEWHPSRVLMGDPSGEQSRPFALIILNQPLHKNTLLAVMKNAHLTICADGGANRLYDCLNHVSAPGIANPNAVVGDLDSLRADVEEAFRKEGIAIVKEPDQYYTDFAKCLKWLRDYARRVSGSDDFVLDVVALGGLGGRVDQGFSQIHHLYMAHQDKSLLNGRIMLLSEQSLSFILESGANHVFLEPNTFAENIGIIPMLGMAKLTTQGLEWDVKNWGTEFGGQMSTSNHIRSEKIEIFVEGRNPLVTLELAARFKAVVD